MKKLVILCIILTILACGTTQPEPQSQPTAICEPQTFNGQGDDVVKVDSAKLAGCTTITLTHSGSGNFIVVPFDANNNRMMTYANEIGSYQGTARWDGQTALLEIDANGQWTIKIE